MGTVDLTYTGLAVGMLLMLIPFYFLWRFRTGLLSSALWGTVRMTVQLLLIGVYLRFLFQWDNEWVNVLWMAVMAVIASHTAVSRTALRREVLLLPVFTGFLATVLLVSLYFLAFVVRADDVFAARFFIPVAGVLFGNMLTVNIMAVNVYYSELQREQDMYYYLLGNGATRFEATLPPFGRHQILFPVHRQHGRAGHRVFPGDDDRTDTRRLDARSSHQIPVDDKRHHGCGLHAVLGYHDFAFRAPHVR